MFTKVFFLLSFAALSIGFHFAFDLLSFDVFYSVPNLVGSPGRRAELLFLGISRA